ncbi:hypothetical protein [Thaumasiovibrio subtropicus]|uniref:hypothetical protein n=1 Tax=Thaumasiovibrio subtropicus TaxID=1891207 RepID=UPI00131C5AD0|nr:hypothetical protein [Thaumasiovibrio subtropicus]
MLIDMVKNEGDVLLVGHGIFNRVLAGALKRRGWHSVGKVGKGYWEYVEYEYRG